ncbi:DUF461 domain-containing protein [Streptomyces sp. NPDC048491]|uniref:DUF461 domain-containing protein n=1 Tax=Streptomyces TaxID=1883 RepID=UPI000C274CBD|nr:DUF461 domain-containing protein [Streptomyces sp. CB01201]MBX7470520.1 DUF461 domain-containing protein [Streptomyces sp. MAG02]PJN00259.1 DUF461 domain-containing protein [Streptomyces sp. CB01201]
MSRSLRRGALAASAIAFSLASLSACAAGNKAQTLGVKADNAYVTVGDIKIQNATVVTQPKADAEGPAVVAATLFNNGTAPQTLDSVQIGSTAVKLSPAKGTGAITIPSHGSVVLGGKNNASAVVDNGREAAKNGDAQKVTFQFSKAGAVSLDAFVVPATSYFEGVGPSELPKPKETPSGEPSGKASNSPSGTPTNSANPNAGGSGKPAGSGSPTHSASTGTGH